MNYLEFEKNRKKEAKISYIYFLVSGVGLLTMLIFLFLNIFLGWNEYFFSFFAIGLILLIVFLILAFAKKEMFNNKYRLDFMNAMLNEVYSNATYKYHNGISKTEVSDLPILPTKIEVDSYNTIISKYKDVALKASNLTIYLNRPFFNPKYFRGYYIQFDSPLEKDEPVIILTKQMICSLENLNELGMNKNEELLPGYIVYQSNGPLDNYLFNENYLTAIKKMSEDLSAEFALLYFKKHIYFLLNKNIKIGNIPFFRPLSETQLKQYQSNIALPIKIVELLKIDTNSKIYNT